MLASPKTIERAIKILEQEILEVRCGLKPVPRGFTDREWLKNAENRLREMKTTRKKALMEVREKIMSLPIG